MAESDRERVREGAAKVSSDIVASIDATFGTVANPQVIAVGMMRQLGATDLGAGEGKTVLVENRPAAKDSPEVIAARKTGSLERVIRAHRTQGVARKLTRQEALDKALGWARGLTQDQRDEFMRSERFESLSDQQAELLSEALTTADNEVYSTPEADVSGLLNYDLDAEVPDPDALVDEDEDEAIDFDESWEAQA